MKRIKSMK